MVRTSIIVLFLAAAGLLVGAAYLLVVVPRVFFVRPCPVGPEDHGGGGSSPAPSPGPAAACANVVCLRVSLPVLGVISFLVGFLIGRATYSCYSWLADGEDREEDASGAAKKAGYIADDPEVATGKN